MAYSVIPTRSGVDSNSSADINQIQTNITDTRGRFGAWDNSLSYVIGEFTSYSGDIYKALTNNSNKQPDSEPTEWELFEPGGGSGDIYPEWSGTYSYSINEMISSAGITYVSLQNTNLNKTPVSEPTWWEAYKPINAENLLADAAADVIIKLGDAGGGNKLEIHDSSDVKQTEITSDGDFDTVGTVKGLSLYSTPIDAGTGFDQIIKLGDDGGSNKLSFLNDSDSEISSLTSEGDFVASSVGCTNIDVLTIAPGSGNDLNIGLGDDAGTNLLSIRNESDVEVANINSLGGALFNGDCTVDADMGVTGDFTPGSIISPAAQDLNVTMSDDGGTYGVSFQNSLDVEVAKINSEGNIDGENITANGSLIGDIESSLIDAGAGNDLVLKMGGNGDAQKISFTDDLDAEVAFMTDEGDMTLSVVRCENFNEMIFVDIKSGSDLEFSMGDAAGGNAVVFQDSSFVQQAKIDSDGNWTSKSNILTGLTAAPGTDNGTVYYNSSTAKFQFRQAGAWEELGGGGAGAQTASGMIGTTSTDGEMTDIDNWTGSGPYTSILTHGLTVSSTYKWEAIVKCFELVGTEYKEVIPAKIEVIDNANIRVTNDTDADLYVTVKN